MGVIRYLASRLCLVRREGEQFIIEPLRFVAFPSGRTDGTGLADGSHTSQPGHRPRKDEITEAVKSHVVIGGDVQSLSHGAG